MRHLLVTNDFPPKVGGIQTYLWELWRRLPPAEVTVLTTAFEGSDGFDRQAPFRIERVGQAMLWPTRRLARRIDRLAAEVDAAVVVLDPALPLGLLAHRLDRPYAVVLHGSELLGRLPGGSRLMGRVVAGACHVIGAGGYPAAEAQRVAGSRMPPVTLVPPGVDSQRFRPLSAAERLEARRRFGLPEDGPLVLGLSRLVPRKGFHVLIDAATRLRPAHPTLTVAIAGSGRQRSALERRAAGAGAAVRFLGRVPDERLPQLYGCADVFAMLCHDRWLGLETEGFGIVFLEAAACGVPQVAGRSGGATDAVVDGVTGIVVEHPRRVRDVAAALDQVLADPVLAARLGQESRRRAAEVFSYDHLAGRLAEALTQAASHGSVRPA